MNTSEDDATYFQRRELASRALAASAEDEAVRRVHSDMADAYRQQAARAAAGEPLPPLSIAR